VGQNVFTGGEITALDTLIERAAEMESGAICNGNGTSGRLNILANIFGKSTQDIFGEFEGITIKNILMVMLSII
jgi:2-oxoglutarate dehydrogenase E1 component